MGLGQNYIISIDIMDSDFDDENVGTISIINNSGKKLGLKICSQENGSAEVWLDSEEVNQIISAFYSAIKVIKHGAKNMPKNERLNIITLFIKAPEWDKDNDVTIGVNTFNKERIGLGISLRKGADPELWMDINNAECIIDALEDAVRNGLKHGI